MRIRLVLLFLAAAFSLNAQSHFDNVDWQYTKTDKNIKVYSVYGSECNYYKAETTYPPTPGVNAAAMQQAINDFDKYLAIFEKIEKFEPIGQTDRGLIIRVLANFSPMKYRVYIIEMWTIHDGDTYITEWEPYTGDDVDRTVTANQKFITTVYGKWTFRDNDDGSLYVCNEYHNNWDYSGLSLKSVTPFEQSVSVKNIRLLYDYVKKHK